MSGTQDVFQRTLLISLLLLPMLAALTILTQCRRNQVRLGERDRVYELQHEGRERSYILHRPAAAASVDPANPRPLLIVMHGGGGTARGAINITRGRFNELADAENFYVVYPTGFDKSWNDGRVDLRSTAHREKIDDVGFLKRVIESIAGEYPIDRARIFSTGISNGGFMSMRLACDLSETVRAVAPVTAQLSRDLFAMCKPQRPVGMLLVNGTDDPIVPYDGGTIELFWTERGEILSTDDTLRFWARRNRCSAQPVVAELPDRDPKDETRVDRVRYPNCATGRDVELLRVRGGGHTWPGGSPYLSERLVGKVSNDIIACDEIWNFFRDQ
ncbi:MAG: esterase [bacterium]|nr:esterase [bacterium]